MRVNAPLLDHRNRAPGAPASGESESERRAAIGGACAITHEEEGGIGLAGELRQADRDGAGEDRPAIEHHEGEGPRAQEEVSAPGGTRGIGRPHDPDRIEGPRPIARIQGAGRVNPRHAEPRAQRRPHEGAREGRLPESCRRDPLADPPPRDPSTGERRIERGHPGGEPGARARGTGDDRGDLQTKGSE